MKQLMLMIWLITFFTLAGQMTYACSCRDLKSALVLSTEPNLTLDEIRKWRLEQTDIAFFIGRVIRIEKVKVRWSRSPAELSPMKRVTVRIEKYWLGVKTREVVVYTGMGNGDCGVPYVKSKQYFFATSRVDGLLNTMPCWSNNIDSKDARTIKTVFGDATVFH